MYTRLTTVLIGVTLLGGSLLSSPAGASVGCADARGVSPKTPVSAQLRNVASCIEATLSMSQRDFVAWVNTKDEDGIDNSLEYPSLYGGTVAPFEYPNPSEYLTRTTGLVDPARGDIWITMHNTFPGQFCLFPLRLGIDSAQLNGIEDARKRCGDRFFPAVPHMSLVDVGKAVGQDTTSGDWFTTLFFNGSVTIPLSKTRGGKVTLSFGTQIWPDDKRVVMVWVSNIIVPNDDRLGSNQSALSTEPVIYKIRRTSVSPFDIEADRPIARRKYLAKLTDSAGLPVMVITESTQTEIISSCCPGVAGQATFNEAGNFVGYDTDARITGLETNAFTALYRSVSDAWFAKDGPAFDIAVQTGQAAGIFLTPTASTKDLVQAMKTIAAKPQDLDTTFMHLPLGQIAFLVQATRPPPLDR